MGRLTAEQKLVARNRIKVNTNQYKRLLQWMITNNQSVFNGINIDNPPIAIVIDKNDNTSYNLHDPSIGDTRTESQYDFCFYYPLTDTPTEQMAGFDSRYSFFQALLSGNTSTMHLFGKKFVSDVHLNLEKVFPTVFPFGLGGPSSPRENKVSYE